MKKIKILLLGRANAVIALLIFVSIYDDDEPKREIETEVVELLSALHFISISEPAKDKHVKIAKADVKSGFLKNRFRGRLKSLSSRISKQNSPT